MSDSKHLFYEENFLTTCLLLSTFIHSMLTERQLHAYVFALENKTC